MTMCEWCEADPQTYCQDCGRMICQDMERGGDDAMAAPYVTSYGDLFCWYCGQSEQRDIDEQEDDEAAEFGRWDYNADWYDPGQPDMAALEDPETPQTFWIGPDESEAPDGSTP